MRMQNGRANEERGKPDQLPDCEDEDGEHDAFRGEHGNSAWDREQTGADHSGRVFARGDQHAEHADRQLAEKETAAEDVRHRIGLDLLLLRRVQLRPLTNVEPGEQGGEAERQHHQDQQRPQGRADRTDLRPFGAQEALEPYGWRRRAWRHGGRGGLSGRAHRASSSTVPPLCADMFGLLVVSTWPNSMLSRVSSMKASSSDASCGVSSCNTSPSRAAISPIRAASRPVTVMASSPVCTLPPSAAMSAASFSASGDLTSTDFSELRSMNSSVVQSAMSRPRPMTMRCSAVTAISFMRWLETKTVRPCEARNFIRFRIQMMPSGSRPFTGSSRTSTCGSPSNAAAMPSR